jgi:hypothetical protein
LKLRVPGGGGAGLRPAGAVAGQGRAARREFCSEVSRDAGEAVAATASRVDHWILFEYRGLWAPDALEGSALRDDIKRYLAEQRDARPHTKLLFIRRTERREAAELRVYLARTKERSGDVYRLDLERYEDVLEYDLVSGPGTRISHPLLLVCTHGKHDRCCARYGRPLFETLCEQVEPEWVWQCSHVGGDRFAGNLVCLPQGAYFGRVGRDDVWPLVDAYLVGKIRMENYRGRSCHTFVVQAAERAVRAETGLTAFDEVAFVSVERAGAARWVVHVLAAPTGEVHRVEVVLGRGPLEYLTCSSQILRRPRRYAETGRELVAPAV